jgi:hypothetical protein
MRHQQTEFQLISFFLLVILIFDDFSVSSECINLVLKKKFQKEVIVYFLEKIQELTDLKFYIIRLRNVGDSLDLYCHSDPIFFAKLIEYSKVRFDELKEKNRV